jgi:hypothetical protein
MRTLLLPYNALGLYPPRTTKHDPSITINRIGAYLPAVSCARIGFTSSITPATTNAIVANHCSTLIARSIALSS